MQHYKGWLCGGLRNIENYAAASKEPSGIAVRDFLQAGCQHTVSEHEKLAYKLERATDKKTVLTRRTRRPQPPPRQLIPHKILTIALIFHGGKNSDKTSDPNLDRCSRKVNGLLIATHPILNKTNRRNSSTTSCVISNIRTLVGHLPWRVKIPLKILHLHRDPDQNPTI